MLFSYSRLNLYETCPLRFYYKYILGLPECVTAPLALGKAVHQSIESLIKGSDYKNAILDGYAACDFHREVSFKEIFKLVENAPVVKNMGETEVYFRCPLSDSPNSPQLQGYIDLVQDGRLVDWKTNRKTYDILGNHQVGLYAWALSKIQKKEWIEGSIYFLRYKQERKYFFSPLEMEQAKIWALRLAEEIKSKLVLLDIMPEKVNEIFSYTPSGACGHCPFVLYCFRDNKI
ncbi:PD-(D/E)XK nuclease family protein [Niallia oryzisoli]|uniref:PD-(D/E)XK nuclease family protein n=1 Tax=Niallia oryzisoli TaxID=1737571 RepID=UPI003735A803